MVLQNTNTAIKYRIEKNREALDGFKLPKITTE